MSQNKVVGDVPFEEVLASSGGDLQGGAIDVVVRSLVESDWIDRLPKGAASSFQETKAILLPTIPEIQKGVEICSFVDRGQKGVERET